MKTISTLTEHDLTKAFELEQICHTIPWSKQTFFSNQGDRYLNFKITIDNQIAGFCICQQVADEANLFNIAIHPDFRKQGLAKALLNHLIDTLITIKSPCPISTLWLEVRQSNSPAIKLYQTLGFNQITVRKNYYPTADGKQEDAIIMAYTLAL
ncbi:ribosomal-protein-alanine N-acetyltransferase [Gilliamella bombicola]|uniref:[Ribosomal protein bS18]-alanine N-acetyltransferase n=1 Tax=Gilliamella bombicola TaxID=1798182 RepID=A0A1C3YNU0_9GAMM|nr:MULTISPECIES: ribosomal protein S18-alanine N-acetyltransferase [Gilliamella]NUF27384.1 ribosomal protein S18-alanine N-acetyltransferase [Gilliamella sp. ESL0254]SCB71712.1 ribosomal-protein-alanine N-acetyltransferase [Gilliamella bombicola]